MPVSGNAPDCPRVLNHRRSTARRLEGVRSTAVARGWKAVNRHSLLWMNPTVRQPVSWISCEVAERTLPTDRALAPRPRFWCSGELGRERLLELCSLRLDAENRAARACHTRVFTRLVPM
jgi:hypothetical protein